MIAMLAALILVQDSPPPMVRFEEPPTPTVQLRRKYKMSDAAFCKMGRKIAKDMTAELPIWVDAITRTDGYAVFCSLRTIATNKFIKTDEATFRQGWLARKEAQWNKTTCDSDLYFEMYQKGWAFVQNITFESGQRYVLRAQC